MSNTLLAQADTAQAAPTTETTASTEQAGSSGNPTAIFGLHGSLFIAQLINFSIVIFVLSRWVFKPLLKAMDDRKTKIELGLKEAKEAKEKLLTAESTKKTVVREAHVVAKDIIEKAKTRAEEEHEKRIQASKKIIEDRLNDAKARAEREMLETKRSAMSQISELVVTAAEKVANGAIDAKAHRQLISDAIAELEQTSS